MSLAHRKSPSWIMRALTSDIWTRQWLPVDVIVAAVMSALLLSVWPDEFWDTVLCVFLIVLFWADVVFGVWRLARANREQMADMKLRIELLERQVRKLRGLPDPDEEAEPR